MSEKVELSAKQFELLMNVMDGKDDGKSNGSYHGPQKLSGKSSWYHLSDREYGALITALGTGQNPRRLTTSEKKFASQTNREAESLPSTSSTASGSTGSHSTQATGTVASQTNNQSSVNGGSSSSGNSGNAGDNGDVGKAAGSADPFTAAYASQQEKIDRVIREIRADPNMTAAELTAKQSVIESATRAMSAITNISKTIHELLMGIIRNFR